MQIPRVVQESEILMMMMVQPGKMRISTTESCLTFLVSGVNLLVCIVM
jgi:hypothetical protein